MFGIGGFELFIILIFGFLIFGPDKLPEIAKTVGKGIARFREAQQEMNEAIGDEKIIDLDNPDQPFKDPIEALDRIAKRQEEKKAGTSAKAPSGAAAKAGSPVKADGPASSGDDEPKQESFTERKARYERERAARKAAEAEAAKKSEVDAGGEKGAAHGATDEGAPSSAGELELAPTVHSGTTPSSQPESTSPAESATADNTPASEGGDA